MSDIATSVDNGTTWAAEATVPPPLGNKQLRPGPLGPGLTRVPAVSTGWSTVWLGFGALTCAFAGACSVDVYRLVVMSSAKRAAAAWPMPGSRCW